MSCRTFVAYPPDLSSFTYLGDGTRDDKLAGLAVQIINAYEADDDALLALYVGLLSDLIGGKHLTITAVESPDPDDPEVTIMVRGVPGTVADAERLFGAIVEGIDGDGRFQRATEEQVEAARKAQARLAALPPELRALHSDDGRSAARIH
jgi:hypothetical protein